MPEAAQDKVLEIRDLSIVAPGRRGPTEIVKGVSLELRRGEVLGLVGESGAGKSTIGLAALGFLRSGLKVTGGSVRFEGQDLLAQPESQRRKLRGTRIAYVAQSAAAAFNPAKRLMDQILEAATRRGGLSRAEARRRAVALFRTMQLPQPESFGRRYPHQVSGGQLQRAMTIMAMICQPSLIVFDEPTTALDVTTQVEVLVAIRRAIKEQDVAAIYISHDLAVVAQLADRVAVLRYGEVVEEAPIREVLEAPRHPYTKTLWAVRELETARNAAEGALLTLTGVSAAYRELPVLHDIALSVARRETVALVGESGSGKSTLGRVIAGLKEPSAGTLDFAGVPLARRVAQRSKETLRRIQIIYQSPDTALNPRHPVRKILGRPLTFFHGLTGRRKAGRVEELLAMVELERGLADRLPAQLSGGQKQRVAIARALAADPELIICDEITSALDKIVQAGILKMLLKLQETLGVSFLFITHDLEVVRSIADRVVVMQGGRIVDQGPREAVFSPPYPDYTRLLLDSVPEMSPDWLERKLA